MWNVLRVDAAARDSAVISHAGHTPHWADIRLFLFFYYLLVVLLKNTTTGNNISFSQNGLKIISASAAVFLQHPLRPSHNVWSFDALIFVCVCVCVKTRSKKPARTLGVAVSCPAGCLKRSNFLLLAHFPMPF